MAESGLALESPLDGYAVEDQVGYLLRRAHQRHAALFLEGMAEAELTPTQFTALIKTVELGRVTQNHLGRLAAMALADRVYIINNGHIVEEMTAATARARPEVLHRYLGV